MNFNESKNCFDENLNLFGDASKQPEKHNLYAGLANIAIGLENLNREIQDIKKLLKRNL